MTSPRKITVDGREYRYFVGKYTTKVQPLDTMKSEFYMNEDYGTPFIHCDYTYSSNPKYETLRDREASKWIITPGVVRGMIKNEIYWKSHYCKKHPNQWITGLCFDPFDVEIHQKHTLMENCPECVCARAEDI